MKTFLSLMIVMAVFFGSVVPCGLDAQDITITVKKEKPDKTHKNTDHKAPFKGKRPSVDVAILLDTSNSMDGLINQAKSQLWNIVQDFANAKKKGKTPILRVSVFEYGNSRLPASEGYIRQVVQLTDNLDEVSEALFALSTNGGDEYCGMVIDESVKRLDWSSEPNAYKAIFIAGNEPFTQGSVKYQSACKKAIGEGIVVNTIHCGDYQTGINGRWKHGAEIAEGEYLNINQDEQIVHIKCPQDEIIIKLNAELNKTYLWYGNKSKREKLGYMQSLQDSNAESSGGIPGRALAKSSSVYRNVGRDLVDTLAEDEEALEGIDAKDLPAELNGKTQTEQRKIVKEMASRRAEIQKKIAELSRERQVYLAAEQAKRRAAGQASAENTFGSVFSRTVRGQLKKSGFEVGQ